MPEIITSQEIDPNVGINEVDIEVYEEIGWRGFSEQLAQDAAQANASLAVITDAEGQFVCLATREMSEFRPLRRDSLCPLGRRSFLLCPPLRVSAKRRVVKGYNSAMLQTKTLKLLSNLQGKVTGVTVKPALFQLVKSHVNGAYPVYPHPYQREDICIFYDHKTLQAHLRLAEEERGFTVTPQAGFDVTAALKERGEWPSE